MLPRSLINKQVQALVKDCNVHPSISCTTYPAQDRKEPGASPGDSGYRGTNWTWCQFSSSQGTRTHTHTVDNDNQPTVYNLWTGKGNFSTQGKPLKHLQTLCVAG